MKIYGYKKGKKVLLELKEATIHCDLDELQNLILFLEDALEKRRPIDASEACYSHYCDWCENWDSNSSDFIIFTGEE